MLDEVFNYRNLSLDANYFVQVDILKKLLKNGFFYKELNKRAYDWQ